jgi:hypothetical protein
LRNPDLVPQIMNLISTIELVPRSSISAVGMGLRELLQNAINHGLLKLPPRQELDRDAHRAQRNNMLTELSGGEVRIQLDATMWHDQKPCWRLTVADSGQCYRNAAWPAEGGLARLANAALALEFNAVEQAFQVWLR